MFSAVLFAAASAVAICAAEGVLRLKNYSMTNYDIEMWRYSKEMKVRSQNPVLDFSHAKGSSALLQSVAIRTNSWGLRGAEVPPRDPHIGRVLFLGGSITLGWGVKESETVTEQLNRMFAQNGPEGRGLERRHRQLQRRAIRRTLLCRTRGPRAKRHRRAILSARRRASAPGRKLFPAP